MTKGVKATFNPPTSSFGTAISPKDARGVGRFLYYKIKGTADPYPTAVKSDPLIEKKALQLAGHLMNFYSFSMNAHPSVKVPKAVLAKAREMRKAKKAVKNG